MSDTHLSLVPDTGVDDAPPSAAALIAVLSEALNGRAVPRCRTLARGSGASADEGLALVQDFLAIRDPGIRQAILHAVGALAATERP